MGRDSWWQNISCVSADAAVLVLAWEPLALLGADLAGSSAGLQHVPHDLLVRARAARGNGSARGTDVGADKDRRRLP
jgi:hypothetical protein